MSGLISANTLDFVRDIRAEQLRRKQAARNAGFGTNLPNSVADVAVPFPYMTELRAVSPETTKHSYLIPYWYRAGGRWVLYDAIDRRLIPDDDQPPGVPMAGRELLACLEGKAPRDLHEDERCPFVSDVQHEMYRLYHVYGRPFWVLQGEKGGHQVNFSPWQQNVLIAKGLSADAPKIGSLPPCPFDRRTSDQLNHLNRLNRLDGRLDRLRESGSVESANAEMEQIQREVREAEMAFIEHQMTPIVDMAMSLVAGPNTRSEHRDQIVQVRPGVAAEAKDAYDAYKETGDYSATLKDFTSHKTR